MTDRPTDHDLLTLSLVAAMTAAITILALKLWMAP